MKSSSSATRSAFSYTAAITPASRMHRASRVSYRVSSVSGRAFCADAMVNDKILSIRRACSGSGCWVRSCWYSCSIFITSTGLYRICLVEICRTRSKGQQNFYARRHRAFSPKNQYILCAFHQCYWRIRSCTGKKRAGTARRSRRDRKILVQVPQLEAFSWSEFRSIAERDWKNRCFPGNNQFFAILFPICS